MSTDAKKYARIGVVGILFRGDRALVIQRSEAVVAPLKWCFPGGGIEPGETERQALVREFQEELGLEISPVEKLCESVTPWNVLLSWWRVEAHDEALGRLCPNREVRQVAWMTLLELRNHPDTLISNVPILDLLLRESGK
ncbi:MAG: NUDIX domain-containing protein [Planctomycetia bacterium]|nr:NUDIX domain-containing protein [Planctomycetia bacterium]